MDWFKSLDAVITILFSVWLGLGLGCTVGYLAKTIMRDRQHAISEAIIKRLQDAAVQHSFRGRCLSCGEPNSGPNDVCAHCLEWSERMDAEMERRRHNGRMP